MMKNIVMQFKKEKLEEMLSMQKQLDDYILEKNDISKEESLIENKFIALKVELNEFMNEIESFKHWKKNKGKDNVLEEAVDIVHFILSIMNDFKVGVKEDIVITQEELEQVSDTSLNRLYIMLDVLLTEAFMRNIWEEEIGAIMIGLMLMLNKCGFTTDDVYDEYIRKNAVNIERQNNNY